MTIDLDILIITQVKKLASLNSTIFGVLFVDSVYFYTLIQLRKDIKYMKEGHPLASELKKAEKIWENPLN